MTFRRRARFDKRPLIREVAVTSRMSYTAEPFVVPIQDTVLKPLRAAGFTDARHDEQIDGRCPVRGWRAII